MVKRYELDAMGRKLVETDDGPWIFYADVDKLQSQLAEAIWLLDRVVVDEEWFESEIWQERCDSLLENLEGKGGE